MSGLLFSGQFIREVFNGLMGFMNLCIFKKVQFQPYSLMEKMSSL